MFRQLPATNSSTFKHFIVVVCLQQSLKNKNNFRFYKEAVDCFIYFRKGHYLNSVLRKIQASFESTLHALNSERGKKYIIILKYSKIILKATR